MRSVMLGLVGESQSAFVKGRKIHDGALIACETVHWLKLKRKASAMIKLDFHKAYDRVKWCFVDTVLEKMGFGITWRAWVKECIRSASISILVNRTPSKYGTSSRRPIIAVFVCSDGGCTQQNDWGGGKERSNISSFSQ
nr:uncharacterized protein LOC112786540 [Arachis hypogaea]